MPKKKVETKPPCPHGMSAGLGCMQCISAAMTRMKKKSPHGILLEVEYNELFVNVANALQSGKETEEIALGRASLDALKHRYGAMYTIGYRAGIRSAANVAADLNALRLDFEDEVLDKFGLLNLKTKDKQDAAPTTSGPSNRKASRDDRSKDAVKRPKRKKTT